MGAPPPSKDWPNLGTPIQSFYKPSIWVIALSYLIFYIISIWRNLGPTEKISGAFPSMNGNN